MKLLLRLYECNLSIESIYWSNTLYNSRSYEWHRKIELFDSMCIMSFIIYDFVYLLVHTGNLSEYIPFLHLILSAPKMVNPGLHLIFQTFTEWWASVINETFPFATWWGTHSSKRKIIWYMKEPYKFQKFSAFCNSEIGL